MARSHKQIKLNPHTFALSTVTIPTGSSFHLVSRSYCSPEMFFASLICISSNLYPKEPSTKKRMKSCLVLRTLALVRSVVLFLRFFAYTVLVCLAIPYELSCHDHELFVEVGSYLRFRRHTKNPDNPLSEPKHE